MITPKDVAARVQRLDALARNLMREVVVIEQCDDPLYYRERQDYLAALRAAVGGVEGARVVLARARRRLEAGAPGRRG